MKSVKQALPSELMAHSPNPFFALNQSGPLVVPYTPPRRKSEPIPTTFPNAHFEKIPTTWPGLEFLPVDQKPSATALPAPKKK
jgi:hypothetical protein